MFEARSPNLTPVARPGGHSRPALRFGRELSALRRNVAVFSHAGARNAGLCPALAEVLNLGLGGSREIE